MENCLIQGTVILSAYDYKSGVLPVGREDHGIPCRNPTHISESVAPRPLLWTNGMKLVLHTGLEPVLDGFWIHFLCHIGILEHVCHKGHTL